MNDDAGISLPGLELDPEPVPAPRRTAPAPQRPPLKPADAGLFGSITDITAADDSYADFMEPSARAVAPAAAAQRAASAATEDRQPVRPSPPFVALNDDPFAPPPGVAAALQAARRAEAPLADAGDPFAPPPGVARAAAAAAPSTARVADMPPSPPVVRQSTPPVATPAPSGVASPHPTGRTGSHSIDRLDMIGIPSGFFDAVDAGGRSGALDLAVGVDSNSVSLLLEPELPPVDGDGVQRSAASVAHRNDALDVDVPSVFPSDDPADVRAAAVAAGAAARGSADPAAPPVAEQAPVRKRHTTLPSVRMPVARPKADTVLTRAVVASMARSAAVHAADEASVGATDAVARCEGAPEATSAPAPPTARPNPLRRRVAPTFPRPAPRRAAPSMLWVEAAARPVDAVVDAGQVDAGEVDDVYVDLDGDVSDAPFVAAASPRHMSGDVPVLDVDDGDIIVSARLVSGGHAAAARSREASASVLPPPAPASPPGTSQIGSAPEEREMSSRPSPSLSASASAGPGLTSSTSRFRRIAPRPTA